MKDTYCEYCNYPYFELKTTTKGYTTTDLVVHIDNEDDTIMNINVFHENSNKDIMIYDGGFSIPIKYCPYCGRRLGQ